MEYINKKPIIYVLSGKAKSGKNEVANMIEKYYNNKKCIQISFGYYLKEYIKNITNWDGLESTKPRDLLQSLGIDLIKNKINDKLLINRVIDDIKVYSYFFDVIIVTDARLKDEVNSLKENFDCITIRINNNKTSPLTLEQQNHITEKDLDEYENYDYIVLNDEFIESKILDILKVN